MPEGYPHQLAALKFKQFTTRFNAADARTQALEDLVREQGSKIEGLEARIEELEDARI